MKKEIIKSIIALRQSEMPFEVFEREQELPINRGKIITIPGVRRCGKSTLMEITINRLLTTGVARERILWIGFDDERLRSMTSEELDLVIAAYMELYPEQPVKEVYMFFDEIQLIKDWEYFVLRLFKSYCKNIYVCGSNATMLSTELSSALRGYPLEFPTFPLSFVEYCRFKGIPTKSALERDKAQLRVAFETYNSESAFPEVVLTHSKSEQLQMLHAYFETMLLKDLVEHYSISNINVVRYFVKRIMANLTKPTSILGLYNDIKSQGLKISKNELYLWANYVCDIFLFIRIPRYDRSLIREQRSPDKYYCIDNGLRTAVLLPQSNDDGKRLENTVMLELCRRKRPGEKISYFQGNAECDFVVQQDDAVAQLIQVCWSIEEKKTLDREMKGITEAAQATGCRKLTIITKDNEATLEQEGLTVRIVPAWKWLLDNVECTM